MGTQEVFHRGRVLAENYFALVSALIRELFSAQSNYGFQSDEASQSKCRWLKKELSKKFSGTDRDSIRVAGVKRVIRREVDSSN